MAEKKPEMIAYPFGILERAAGLFEVAEIVRPSGLFITLPEAYASREGALRAIEAIQSGKPPKRFTICAGLNKAWAVLDTRLDRRVVDCDMASDAMREADNLNANPKDLPDTGGQMVVSFRPRNVVPFPRK
jgi:hypothetical protein